MLLNKIKHQFASQGRAHRHSGLRLWFCRRAPLKSCDLDLLLATTCRLIQFSRASKIPEKWITLTFLFGISSSTIHRDMQAAEFSTPPCKESHYIYLWILCCVYVTGSLSFKENQDWDSGTKLKMHQKNSISKINNTLMKYSKLMQTFYNSENINF